MMAVFVMGIMLLGLYGALAYGFREVQLSREDERATQILAERMEVIRLMSWDQLVNLPGYVPTNFTASYSLANPTNITASSAIYTGAVAVTSVPISETYSNDLRQITLSLTWNSSGKLHTRSVTTFASRYGLQNYVY